VWGVLCFLVNKPLNAMIGHSGLWGGGWLGVMEKGGYESLCGGVAFFCVCLHLEIVGVWGGVCFFLFVGEGGVLLCCGGVVVSVCFVCFLLVGLGVMVVDVGGVWWFLLGVFCWWAWWVSGVVWGWCL